MEANVVKMLLPERASSGAGPPTKLTLRTSRQVHRRPAACLQPSTLAKQAGRTVSHACCVQYMRACANLQATGKGTSVHPSGRSWSLEIGSMAFYRVSAQLAGQLQPPSSQLPPGTRLSLSAGSNMDSVIVQLAPDKPSDMQLAAPDTQRAAVPLPARRGAEAPQRPGPAGRPVRQTSQVVQHCYKPSHM